MTAPLTDRIASSQRLERERALAELDSSLKEGSSFDASLLPSLSQDAASPEALLGSLGAWALLVRHKAALAPSLETDALRLLSHAESRVRSAAGELLAELCRREGPGVFERCSSNLYELIRTNSERSVGAEESGLVEKLGSQDVFHDTAGWNALETSLGALLGFATVMGKAFAPYMTEDLLGLLWDCVEHRNRFVRESGFRLLAQLLRCQPPKAVLEKLVLRLATGLSDNWSQVRMAASLAARALVEETRLEGLSEEAMRALVPPMCLNRFYLAQGVQIYSQETWARARQTQATLVTDHLGPIASFYSVQCGADNHAVREAACQAIAELAAKLPKEALEPEAKALVASLVRAFGDDSWPVRDAATKAVAGFLAAFPRLGLEEAGLSVEAVVLPAMWAQLTDCIPSVRQGAAESLARLAQAYQPLQPAVVDLILSWLERDLRAVEGQKAEEGPSRLSPSPAVFGVAERRAVDKRHENQTMYSCGSLAPKMKAGGGCGDTTFQRPAEPWEVTDGSCRLLSELPSSVPSRRAEVSKLVPLLCAAAQAEHYAGAAKLRAALCQGLPTLANGLGKQDFKPHLQELLVHVVAPALASDVRLTEAAGEECLCRLGSFLGPSILRGRIQMLPRPQPLMDRYDRLVPAP